MSECRFVCDSFPQIKNTKLFYLDGNVYCKSCEKHFPRFFTGKYCPCCKSAVRTKPRRQNGKMRVMMVMALSR